MFKLSYLMLIMLYKNSMLIVVIFNCGKLYYLNVRKYDLFIKIYQNILSDWYVKANSIPGFATKSFQFI